MINGRLSALIEVGSGFHPELTGRENIFLNGAILGMRRREIAEKLDSIAEFAGVEAFLDVPVKRFSSGMYVRLGFSIAVAPRSGHPAARRGARRRRRGVPGEVPDRASRGCAEPGTTIVFISHDLAAVERICDRVILMRRGEVAATGKPREIIALYQQQIEPSRINTMKTAVEDDRAVIQSLAFLAPNGLRPAVFHTGDPLVARIEYVAHQEIRDAVFEIFVRTGDLTELCQLTTETSGSRSTFPSARGRSSSSATSSRCSRGCTTRTCA